MQRQQQQLVTQMQAEKDRMGLEDLQQLSLSGEGFSGLRDLYGLCLDALRRGMSAQSFKAMLDDYLREYPTSIVLLLAEGEWYEREGAPERALEMYTRILNINPAVVQAITAMARLHEQNGDLESAILDYRRLQSIDAANTAAYDGLLRLHSRLGRLDELCDEWKRLYAVRSDDKILKERLIEALHKANRREEARNLTH
jgi:tetratricopeptide (TPR) repeat protein